MRQFFSPLLGGFRQGYSTQHVLLNFLQRCKNSNDNKGLAGALFMDLSKAFDSLNHDLLLAKLNAYGINLDALQLIRSYLSKRNQRVRVNSTFSDWKEIKLEYLRGQFWGLYLMYLLMILSCLSKSLIFVIMRTIRLSLHAIQHLKLLFGN